MSRSEGRSASSPWSRRTRYVTRTAPYLGRKTTSRSPTTSTSRSAISTAPTRSTSIRACHADVQARARTCLDRPGWRPHLTLDLFTGNFVVLAGREGSAWIDAAPKAAATFPGLRLDAVGINDDHLPRRMASRRRARRWFGRTASWRGVRSRGPASLQENCRARSAPLWRDNRRHETDDTRCDRCNCHPGAGAGISPAAAPTTARAVR